eukprot:s47_g30.t3
MLIFFVVEAVFTFRQVMKRKEWPGRSPHLTSPLGLALKDVGLRATISSFFVPMAADSSMVSDQPLTTQGRAAYDVQRYSQLYRSLQAEFRPKCLTHLRYDSVDISFTNAGSYRRSERKGRHVEPLSKIFASSKMLPSKATLPDAMMRARYPAEAKEKSETSSRRSRRSSASSQRLGMQVDLRWPCAATFERPKSCRSLGARKHKTLALALGAAAMKCPSSQEIGLHEPMPRIRKGDELGPHHNPFLTRFLDRQPGGSFFAGSGLSAGKVTALPTAGRLIPADHEFAMKTQLVVNRTDFYRCQGRILSV